MDYELKHFTKDEIVITPATAQRMLVFFFGKDSVPPAESLTDADVAFAQALLLEAIDKSYAMGYVQNIFDTFFMKVPTDVEGMIKDFAKKATKTWFDHATGKDLSNPKIYNAVKNGIAYNFSEAWKIRMQGGDLTY
jgi:hypothetical protein